MLLDRTVQAEAGYSGVQGKQPQRSAQVSGAGSEERPQLIASSTGPGVWPHTTGPAPTSQRDEWRRVWEDARKWKDFVSFKNHYFRASLVAQWLRVRLPMQGTRVRVPVWEDPTCRGAAGPVSHGHWACASGACAPQWERPQQWEARVPQNNNNNNNESLLINRISLPGQ